MKDQISSGGRLREEWDFDARLYTKWDENGVQVLQRMFGSAENAAADERIAAATQESNEGTLTGQLGNGQIFDNLRTVANGTGVFATAALRDAAIRTCARALVILIRLKIRKLDALD